MGKVMNAQAENVLDALFGGATLDVPATWYIGLSSTEPANDGTGITEPSGDAYARVASTNDVTNWPACTADTRRKSNGLTVSFPEATGLWGDMSHFVLFDALTAGVPRAWGQLDSVYTADVGVQLSFDPDTLVVTAP